MQRVAPCGAVSQLCAWSAPHAAACLKHRPAPPPACPPAPIPAQDPDIAAKRAAALYSADERATIRRAHENPAVLQLYKDHLGQPNSEEVGSASCRSALRSSKPQRQLVQPCSNLFQPFGLTSRDMAPWGPAGGAPAAHLLRR